MIKNMVEIAKLIKEAMEEPKRVSLKEAIEKGLEANLSNALACTDITPLMLVGRQKAITSAFYKNEITEEDMEEFDKALKDIALLFGTHCDIAPKGSTLLELESLGVELTPEIREALR